MQGRISAMVLVLLASVAAHSADGSSSYQCTGASISGTIRIDEVGGDTKFHRYSSIAHLNIDQREVTLKESGEVSYYKDDSRADGWKYDFNRRLYALGGLKLNIGQMGEVFYLEVGSDVGHAEGYLGRRDHDKGPIEYPVYDFECDLL